MKKRFQFKTCPKCFGERFVNSCLCPICKGDGCILVVIGVEPTLLGLDRLISDIKNSS